MLISLKLKLRGPAHQVTYGRDEFWESVAAASATDKSIFISQSLADEYEARLIKTFAFTLENQTNLELRRNLAPQGKYLRPLSPQIRIRLLTIEYGSIEHILDVSGIDSDATRDFVLNMLEVFAPPSFRSATGLSVWLEASAVQIEHKSSPPAEETSKSKKSLEALGKAWMISNLSLLVPVALTLAVCFVAFTWISKESEVNRTEGLELQKERTEIIKALIIQNAKASDWIAAQNKEANGVYRNLDEILLKIVQTKIEGHQNPKTP